MKRLTATAVAILVLTPLGAGAQGADEEEQDEFYRDVDEAPAVETDEGGGGASSGADVAVAAEGPSDDGIARRFRLSGFTYENIFSARPRSTDLSPDATFYYAMSYSFQPRFYVTDWFHLRARFDLEHELTDGGTTYLREPLASDTTIDAWFTDVLDPVTDWVDLHLFARLTFPSSKASQARTLQTGVTAGLTLMRSFPVLEGLRLSYGFSASKYFNRYTTAVQEAPTLSCVAGADFDCASQVNTGARNASWAIRNVFGLTFSPIERLTFSASVSWNTQLLYSLTDADASDLYGGVVCADPRACPIVPDELNTDMRVGLAYVLALGYDILPWLGVAVGTSTFNPQLTPSSDYRAPFFNRYTNFFIDINITVDELVQSIMGRSGTRSRVDEV